MNKIIFSALVILSANSAFAETFSCVYGGSTVGRDPAYIINSITVSYSYDRISKIYDNYEVSVNGKYGGWAYRGSAKPDAFTTIQIDDFLYGQTLMATIYDPTYGSNAFYNSYNIGPSEQFRLSCKRLN
jgi:hypothetical protein